MSVCERECVRVGERKKVCVCVCVSELVCACACACLCLHVCVRKCARVYLIASMDIGEKH